jgi:hypothetical protein
MEGAHEMLHTDMAIINSMVAARQEQLAASMWESHRRSSLIVGFGSLLMRIGQWMKNDPSAPGDETPMIPARKRPQLA